MEKLFAGEVLEIGIVDPALAHPFVRQAEHMLEDEELDHEAGLGCRSALVAEPVGQLAIDPLSIDLPRSRTIS